MHALIFDLDGTLVDTAWGSRSYLADPAHPDATCHVSARWSDPTARLEGTVITELRRYRMRPDA